MFELGFKESLVVKVRGSKFMCEECSLFGTDCFDFACNFYDRKDEKDVFFDVVKENELSESNKDEYFCSAGKPVSEDGKCRISGDLIRKVGVNYCGKCGNFHKKYPTLEEYKEEYGGEWHGAVYYRIKPVLRYWVSADLDFVLLETKGIYRDFVEIVVACTPFGKPDKDFEVIKKKI